jgi:hypothetical protein
LILIHVEYCKDCKRIFIRGKGEEYRRASEGYWVRGKHSTSKIIYQNYSRKVNFLKSFIKNEQAT